MSKGIRGGKGRYRVGDKGTLFVYEDWYCWRCADGRFVDEEILTSTEDGIPLCPNCDAEMHERPQTSVDVMEASLEDRD